MNVERGQTLSHYRLLEKIGEGGMGVVWKAEDTLLGRTVAIKVLPADHARDEKRRKMFFDEARLASSLSEAYIVQVHDFGREGDLDFIVMEYVEGKALNKVLHGKPMPPERVVEIGHQVARALSKAHRKGLLHRDLKPANILITPDGDAKVVDFGLATLFTPQESTIGTAGPTQTITEGLADRQKGVVGTIPYMSPEQVRGEKLDARSDIFSLGTVLYEMTTGQRPFRGTTNREVASEILKSRPKAVHESVAKVPLDLDRIIMKSLSSRRGDRYQNTEDLAVDLKRLGRDLVSGSSPSYEELAKVVKPRRRWVGVAALIGVLAIALGYWKFGPIPKESSTGRKMIVVLPFENLGPAEDEYFAADMTEEITSRLAVVSGLGVISRKSAIQYANTDKSTKQIGEELGVDYLLEGTVRWARESMGTSRVRITPQLIRVRDNIHLWAESYDRVIDDIFEVQSEIAGKVMEQLGVVLLEPERKAIAFKPTENFEAYEAYLQGIHNKRQPAEFSEEILQLRIQLFQRAVDLDPFFALAYAELSLAHSRQYWEDARRFAKHREMAKRAVDRAVELAPESPEVHLALGFYHYWGHLEYKRALEEFTIARIGMPNNAELFMGTGFVLRRQGKWEDALPYLQRGLELDPLNPTFALELCNHYAWLRRYQEALPYCDRVIALTPGSVDSYATKARIFHVWKGTTEEARAALEASPKSDSPDLIMPWFWQEIYEGKYQEALDRISSSPDEAVEAHTKALRSALAYDLLNESQLAHSSYDSARILLEGKLREWPDDPWLHRDLGIAYAGLSRKEEAIREGKRGTGLWPISKAYHEGEKLLRGLTLIYTMVGEHDAALDQIEYHLSIPSGITIPILRLDPRWKPLWDHPRFQELVEKYG